MYFSLQYLPLSDATVLTFVAPILTTFAGAIFLKEVLSLKEKCAACMCSQATSTIIEVYGVLLVCSFFGVILIARPHFIFGSPKGEPSVVATPGQRMLSFGLEGTYLSSRCFLSCHAIVLLSLASWGRLELVSVLSATLIHLSYFLQTPSSAQSENEHTHFIPFRFSLHSVF